MSKFVNSLQIHYNEIIKIVKEMGYNTDLDLQNMEETPFRMAKSLTEFIRPKKEIKREITKIVKKVFDSSYSGMVIGQNLRTVGMCPHHFLPVAYRISIAYLPNSNEDDTPEVLGLSKLSRIANILSQRPVLQETLTEDIANVLSTNHFENNDFGGIKTDGCGVVIEGLHLCMSCRGVKQHESSIITSTLTGAFKEDGRTRNEFLNFVNSKRPERIL